jgi:hypothetical protein
MHSWHIMKPHRQVQQKGNSFLQQWQVLGPFLRRRIGRDFLGT